MSISLIRNHAGQDRGDGDVENRAEDQRDR